LTEHDGVKKALLTGAPRLGLALGPAPARAGPDYTTRQLKSSQKNELDGVGRYTNSFILELSLCENQ